MGEILGKRPSWAEIHLPALRGNLAWLRARAGDRRIIAVVKADGYGHGAVRVARELGAAGCEALAVATFDEASELRDAGVELPILLLEGLHAPEQADAILQRRLVPVVGRLDTLEALEAAGRRAGRPCPVHVKVDTGMSRLGFTPAEVGPALDRIGRGEGLALDGLMSHLAEADDPSAASVAAQRERFREVLAQVREHAGQPAWVHLDSSAGVIHGPTPDTTAVRVGLALYGADPTLGGAADLEPVMSLRSRAIHARTVPAGTRIGYGGAFCTRLESRILTIPIGYADGLPRAAGGRFSVGLRGRRVPLVGRVSMDLATIDAGVEWDAGVGEEILIFGRNGESVIPVEELASAVGTIAYEILVKIGPRVPRIPRSE